ncbi:MAG: DUF3990 domain-containing protein [Candidatus Adiutrix sp.]|jgi:hypothetical protein|nr:DUF3990 domain-containing protein [Candidatus Adiutrix sp.]
MLLFHGSNQEVAAPQLIDQTRGLDFGVGFYLTTSEKQAKRFAEIIVNRRKKGLATVSIYEFDMAQAERSLNICRFTETNGEWLEFVKNNRLKQYCGVKYDIVIGAVANDDVLPTIILYINGQLDADLTIGALKTRKLVDQVCLKSEKAISLLKFRRAEVSL